MSAFSEKRFYDAANAYYQGAIILMYNEGPSDASATTFDLTSPVVHCATSSLKLYLKCLLAFEGKDQDNRVEQLADLYQSLNDETQSLILEKFGEFSGSALSPPDLITGLSNLDHALADWRHVLEEETLVNLDELGEMILATRSAIADFKPDWG